MVNKPTYKEYSDEIDGCLPPLDESWWEAVLAEDNAQQGYTSNHPSEYTRGERKHSSGATKADSELVDWELATRLYEHDEVCCLDVTGYNRGGLLVSGEGLQGFVPVSHVVEIAGEKCDEGSQEQLISYVGRSLELKVIECDQERGRVVFSERAALATPGSRNQLLDNLQPGDCVRGVVTNVTDFGVFIDLGGIEGLIHVSELSWGRVRHPSDVVRYDQELEVYVINIDQERSRVALSLKRLCSNPWETADDHYAPGQITEAVITSIVPFGAFARLEDGLDGLIHISEIGSGQGNIDPYEFLSEGQKIQVRILHVDACKQRLGLSTRIDL
jgi:small subunit ribosomal protein S1